MSPPSTVPVTRPPFESDRAGPSRESFEPYKSVVYMHAQRGQLLDVQTKESRIDQGGRGNLETSINFYIAACTVPWSFLAVGAAVGRLTVSTDPRRMPCPPSTAPTPQPVVVPFSDEGVALEASRGDPEGRGRWGCVWGARRDAPQLCICGRQNEVQGTVDSK